MSEAFQVGVRAREILLALCRDFVATGEPSSSLALRERHGLAWSTATIRQELASLEAAYLLRKPHAASGRIPTAAGLRLYVESLPVLDAPSAEVRGVIDAGMGALTMGGMESGRALRGLTRVMAELSGYVAVAFYGDACRPRLRQVELWPTGPGRALVVMTTLDGARSVRRVDFDKELIQADGDLERVEGLLSDLLVGRDLDEARAHFERAVASEQAKLDRVFAQAVKWGLRLCGGLAMDPLWLKVAGQGTLAARGSGPAPLELSGILGVLEDYQRLAHVLCQLLPQGSSEAQVKLGIDLEAADGLGDGARLRGGSGSGLLSLVGCRVSPHAAWVSSGTQTGVLALLGPPRMDYRRVIPLVEYAARALANET